MTEKQPRIIAFDFGLKTGIAANFAPRLSVGYVYEGGGVNGWETLRGIRFATFDIDERIKALPTLEVHPGTRCLIFYNFLHRFLRMNAGVDIVLYEFNMFGRGWAGFYESAWKALLYVLVEDLKFQYDGIDAPKLKSFIFGEGWEGARDKGAAFEEIKQRFGNGFRNDDEAHAAALIYYYYDKKGERL